MTREVKEKKTCQRLPAPFEPVIIMAIHLMLNDQQELSFLVEETSFVWLRYRGAGIYIRDIIPVGYALAHYISFTHCTHRLFVHAHSHKQPNKKIIDLYSVNFLGTP
jgi:hypothetical protein